MKALILAAFLAETVPFKALSQTTSSAPVDPKLYTIVESMPRFGDTAEDVLRYLASNIRYPVSAIQNRVQGTVKVGFVVGADGKLSNIHLLDSVHHALDAEALRVIRTMPPWKPGIQNGKPVSVNFHVPVTFRIGKAPQVFENAYYTGSLAALNRRLNYPPYPEAARAAQAQGRVIVLFKVDTTGLITAVRAMPPPTGAQPRKSASQVQPPVLHPALVAAAENVVRAMPAWQPGLLDGRPTVTENALLVTYQLQAPADTVYSMVEQMPQFPGGQQALSSHLARNSTYPSQARKDKAEGDVILHFVINEQGKIEAPEVLQSIHPALDAEALRVVGKLPPFIPGRHYGRPVKVSYILPITFSRY